LWSNTPSLEIPIETEPNEVHPLEVAACIRKALRPDDILSVDGGEFCQWMRQGLHDVPNRWLWNSKFGIIGNSIPMAFGVMAAGHRGRTIAIMGDGGSAYHIAEFEAAARYGLPFTAIIGNDARWGAEWHLQAHRYGADRTFDTDLLRARYDQVAAGYGALGFHAQTAAAFREALDAALVSGKPACINVDIQSLRSPSVPP
jgi:acetolactate synthase-1/2/3 large subunit